MNPSESIYRTQSLPLIPILLETKARGIAIDHEECKKWKKILQARKDYATSIAQGYTKTQDLPAKERFNIGSPKQVVDWLLGEGVKLKKKRGALSPTVDKDAIAKLRRNYFDYSPDDERDGVSEDMIDTYISQGAHPVLEARSMYMKVQTLLGNYINPALKVDRMYPDQLIHTQTSGRWSTTKPALPTTPPKLRKIYKPDPGWCFLVFDWSQIELRISSALADDTPTIDAMNEGLDIHTINMCDIFGYEYPENLQTPYAEGMNDAWKARYKITSDKDKRRVFAKTFVYRIRYRGDARFAKDMPGAEANGIDSKGLVQASRRYLAAHPALVKYWSLVDKEILETRTIRTIYGRKRYLNGSKKSSGQGVPEICREGSNHPMQGTVADIFNQVVLDIYQARQSIDLKWVYGAHDSQVWTCPIAYAKLAQELIEPIASQERQIGNHKIPLPIEWEGVRYG